MSDSTSELEARQALGSRQRTKPSMEQASSRWSGEGLRISETRHKAQLLLKRLAIVLVYVLALLVCLVLLLLYVATVLPAKRLRNYLARSREDEALTNDWWGLHAGDDDSARAKRTPADMDMRKGVELRHCYITTRDGIKLATDVWIPSKALAEKGSLPVIFHQARYYRSATLRWPFNLIVNGGKPINFINDPFFKSFLSHGMILVSVDVRGTGASFGTHLGPWSPEEREDSMEVLEWIDRQPWSNGRVGLWGLSYEGTSAFFTSLLRHPTVVCCCPMFFFWDVYDDISHPGGVPMKYFPREWQCFNDSLDSGWVQSTGWMARIFLEGVTPVNPEDPWGYQVNQALEEHKDNWSLLKDSHIRYMDDTSKLTDRAVKFACASQVVHELLAKDGVTAGSSPPSSATKTMSSPLPCTNMEPETTGSYAVVGSWEGREERVPLVGFDEVRSEKKVRLRAAEAGVVQGAGAREIEMTSTVEMNGLPEADEVIVTDGDLAVGGRRGDAGEAAPGDTTIMNEFGPERGAQAAVPQGIGGGDRGVFDEGRKGTLEETLPYYLHVSGWLDASAHAAVMAFMTLPCRGSELLIGPWNHGGHQHVRPHHITSKSRFDFCTEVSGFFVRRLSAHNSRGSSPKGQEVVTEAGRKKSSAVTSLRFAQAESLENAGARPVGNVDVTREESTGAFSSPDCHAASTLPLLPATPSIPQAPPTTVDVGIDVAGAVAEVAEAEVLPETSRAFVESEDAAALWMRSRPRVRFYTHQEERWHEASTFPSAPSYKADVVLSLGKQRPRQHQQQPTPMINIGISTTTDTGIAKGAPANPGRIAALARSARSTYRYSQSGSRSGLAKLRAEGSWNPFVARHSWIRRRTLDKDGGKGGLDEFLGGAKTPTASDGEDWDEELIDDDEHVVEENRKSLEEDNDREFHGTVNAGGVVPGLREHADDEEGVEEKVKRTSVRMKNKLTARLAKWPPFRTSKLSLFQDVQEEEECHELVVDVENDHDGEGVSRWAAMTEILSLISYKMDGLRSNHLRFTSPPLKQDMEVTGYPVVSLWVSTADDLPNLDVFAYLQAVRPRTGLSIYVTEGCFRAEHRKEAKRRYPVEVRALPGVPIHSYLRSDSQSMQKGRPVELKFKLMPTSFRFLKGQRVRLSIGGADARHFHPIARPHAEDKQMGERPSPCATIHDPTSTTSHASDVMPTEFAAKVARRVLRVHTGGVYDSSVSLPVPRSDGGGEHRREGGARKNVATPRTESFARALWARARRQRSLSSPNILGAVAQQAVTGGPLRQGRWALKGNGQRGRSEVRSRVLDVDRDEEARIFVRSS